MTVPGLTLVVAGALLGSPRWADRERGESYLTHAGPGLVYADGLARGTADAEVRVRAERVVRTWVPPVGFRFRYTEGRPTYRVHSVDRGYVWTWDDNLWSHGTFKVEDFKAAVLANRWGG